MVISPPWLANISVHPEQSSIHCDGPDEWRKAARLNIYNGTDNVKVVASRDIISSGISTAPQATREELKAAIDEAHKMRWVKGLLPRTGTRSNNECN